MKTAIRKWSDVAPAERERILARSQGDIDALGDSVRAICDGVRLDGDTAIRRYTLEFDRVDLTDLPLAVTLEEFDRADASLTPEVKSALDYAIDNTRTFHATQHRGAGEMVEVRPGLWAMERTTPIASAALYVPRGRGSFPSMLYMLAVPAVLAGTPDVSVFTPPGSDGSVDAAVLYAARRCGVHRVYRIGGAQAVAAAAYGTESVRPAVKVVGPGSAYVAAAKRVVAGIVDVGLPAGPSESIVLADRHADPYTVALDLMIEAEHGSDSSALLVTDDEEFAAAVAAHIEALWEEVPEPRRTFLADVFAGYGGVILTDTWSDAVNFVNDFAPEHLMVHTRDPYADLSEIVNAGEILIGPHSAFSLANYAAGANAVLPTGRWARTYSPVSVRDFQKRSSVVHITERAYQEMKDHVIALADYEGFHTHAAALRKRRAP